MKKELRKIRNRLGDRIPSGELDTCDLLIAIKLHLDELDEFIDKIDAQCVSSNVVRQSEQLCECDAPLICTNIKGGEYCGICEKDLD